MTDAPDAAAFWVRIALDGTINEHGSGDAVPVGAAAITREQWQTVEGCLPWQCRLINGVVLPIPPITQAAVSLADVKAAAIERVDREAEEARMRFLTRGAGQMLEYQATQADAARLMIVGGDAQATDYPWLAAEQEALADIGMEFTLEKVAEAVIQVMETWSANGATIKRIRRGAKLRIEAANDIDTVHAVIEGVAWPTP